MVVLAIKERMMRVSIVSAKSTTKGVSAVSLHGDLNIHYSVVLTLNHARILLDLKQGRIYGYRSRVRVGRGHI